MLNRKAITIGICLSLPIYLGLSRLITNNIRLSKKREQIVLPLIAISSIISGAVSFKYLLNKGPIKSVFVSILMMLSALTFKTTATKLMYRGVLGQDSNWSIGEEDDMVDED